MNNFIKIGNKKIGEGEKTFIIAEMSANHLQSFERAVEIIKKAKESGADAIKLQTYTPDTITIDCNNEYFQIKQGTIWMEQLYISFIKSIYPWEWQPKLKK
ncbi:N-acetylneuraminate synthase family protein [Clostridium botulinum]|nr:N-acetylneuraminate synthase family protein [Clostridium botulinum]